MDKNSDRLTLVPYFPNEKQTLKWYQDPKICKQVDNIDTVYDLTKLRRMYEYLSVHECMGGATIFNIKGN